MTVCENALIREVLDTLPAPLVEDWAERQAIMEVDGGRPRALAECEALLSVLRRYPEVLCGLTALRFQLDGTPRWLVASDVEIAGRHLAHVGATEVNVVPLLQVVSGPCSGLASLGPIRSG